MMSGKDILFDENGPGLADFLPDTSSGYTAQAGAPLEWRGLSTSLPALEMNGL